jgi:hypothetical protein
VLCDVMLPQIRSLAELKVIKYVIRRTFGWGKFVDRISLRQFMHGVTTRKVVREGEIFTQVEIQVDCGTGLAKNSVRRGLKRAIEHGFLIRYMVCGMCVQEILEEQPPVRCPHCEQPYRGREQFWYSLRLRSPTLAELPREARFDYLRNLGRNRQEFFAALRELLEPEEEAERETIIQEIDIRNTDSKETVVELLSAFGFVQAASEAVAEEALKAGLTAEDVARWIVYVSEQGTLNNPRGFLRAKLRSGEEPPRDDPDDRYVSGKYADYIKH